MARSVWACQRMRPFFVVRAVRVPSRYPGIEAQRSLREALLGLERRRREVESSSLLVEKCSRCDAVATTARRRAGARVNACEM